MPCIGPTPAEKRQMEINECKRLYGVAGTELDIATRVACHLANGQHNELTRRWTEVHKLRDDERERAEVAAQNERDIQRKVKAYERSLRQGRSK